MKKVYGMRGLPGSGKDTYIKSRWDTDKITVCSADHFFMVDGEYRFDESKLSLAHATCMRNFLHALASNVEIVIVNNTNINVHEISPYAAVAAAMEYQFEVIEIKAKTEHCIARNSHGVSAQQIGAMAEAMRREVLPPWWTVTKIQTKPKDGNDKDVAALLKAFETRKVPACFAECAEDGICDTLTIVPDKNSKQHLWIFASWGGDVGWLERSRVPEMVRLITEASSESTSEEIEDAVITTLSG
jgi:predicted kinase